MVLMLSNYDKNLLVDHKCLQGNKHNEFKLFFCTDKPKETLRAF